MRKVLLSVLLFMYIAVNIQSQTNNSAITIKGIEKDEVDNSARMGTDVKTNANGDNMAIIKINTRDTGFGFDIGVTKPVVEYKVGEVWVYVSPGIKWFSMNHPKYGKSENYNIPIRIESSAVYVLNVEFKGSDGQVVVLDYGFLIIKTEPKNATVFINDNSITNDVGEVQRKYSYGKYKIRVEAPLFHPYTTIINLTGSTQPVDVKLVPNFGWLNINTLPESGAMISIDGERQITKTPFKSDKIRSGEHTVVMSKEMFKTVTEKIVIKDNEITNLNVNMPVNFGEITINSLSGADIYIDGELKSNSNRKGRLDNGIYTLEARKDRHITAKKDIHVIPGQPQTIELTPKPIVGNLDVMCVPSGSDIMIGGKHYGTTPKTITGLLIGEYEVVLSKANYGTERRTVTIQDGKTSEVITTLTEGKNIVITSNPAGAKLYIDNVYKGITPLTLSLGFKDHAVILDNNGRKTVRDNITVSEAGPSTFNFNVNHSTNVTITSTPPGAILYVDDIYRGITPQSMYMDFGQHRVKLSNAGKKEIETSIDVAENGKSSFDFNVNGSKLVIFEGSPKSAVYINNSYRGETPLKLELDYNVYSLMLDNGGEKHTDYFIVNDNTDKKYMYKFSKNTRPEESKNASTELLTRGFITYGISAPIMDKLTVSSYMDLNLGFVVNRVGFYFRIKTNFDFSYSGSLSSIMLDKGDELIAGYSKINRLEGGWRTSF